MGRDELIASGREAWSQADKDSPQKDLEPDLGILEDFFINTKEL